MIGERIGKYEILEEIGHGGMATVYRGLDTNLEREVAVKLLHPHLADREESRHRFRREAHAVARLRHNNIVEIYDYSGEESERSYIVMEFIRGPTLKQFLDEHAVDLPEVGALLAVPICRAVAHAHKLGIIHRDIKPENMMVSYSSGRATVKLTDFGIAAMVDTEKLTMTGQLLGSPAYMAPEVVSGERIDRRTDLFSLGVILYQLAVGELPFKGKNPHEVLKKIAEASYIRPVIANPKVGDPLDRMIAKALARDPDDRYAEAAELLTDLEQHLVRVGISAPDEELELFFKNPDIYQEKQRGILVSKLLETGEHELREGKAASALSTFNRVLAFEPDHPTVQSQLHRLQRRRSVRLALRAVTLMAALVACGFAAAWGIGKLRRASSAGAPRSNSNAMNAAAGTDAAVPGDGAASEPDAAIQVASTPDAAPSAPLTRDAGVDGGSPMRPRVAGTMTRVVAMTPRPLPIIRRRFLLAVRPSTWRVWLDGRLLTPPGAAGLPRDILVGPGDHTLHFEAPGHQSRNIPIASTRPGGSITGTLAFLPSVVLLRAVSLGKKPIEARFKFLHPPALAARGWLAANTRHTVPFVLEASAARIRVFKRGYRVLNVAVQLKPGENTTKLVRLQKIAPH